MSNKALCIPVSGIARNSWWEVMELWQGA